MKFLYGIFGILVGIFLGLYCYVYNYQDRVEDLKVCRIAVFQPATHPALDEIAQGFIDTMGNKYRFDRYNANGNKILMRSQAEEILQHNYDLIFTIAVSPSVMIKDLVIKKGLHVPVVFTAVDDPISLDLQYEMMTGVVDHSNYQRQLDITIALKPSIKKIVLVYDQSQASGLHKDKMQIQAILDQKNIKLQSVEILQSSQIVQMVQPFLSDCDLVMVLKDNTIVSGIDSLIKLCEQYGVTLLASDLNSGAKGAALAYGIYEAQSGIQAALQARLIIEQGKAPSQVPIVAVQDMIMKINISHAAAQGLYIDYNNIVMTDVSIDTQG